MNIGNVELHTLPRRTGKTSMLINMIRKDKNKIGLVTPNHVMAKYILNRVLESVKQLETPEQILAFDAGSDTTIYVEEWYCISQDVQDVLIKVSLGDNVKVAAVGTSPEMQIQFIGRNR